METPIGNYSPHFSYLFIQEVHLSYINEIDGWKPSFVRYLLIMEYDQMS